MPPALSLARTGVLRFSAGVLAGLVVFGAADWHYYGRPWESLWMYLQYNVFTGTSASFFGSQPVSVYAEFFTWRWARYPILAPAGIALAIAAGMGYGVYGLAVRRFMYGFHPVYAFGVIALYTGSALVVAMLAFGRGHGAEVLELGSRELWYLGLSAFLGIAIGHVLYYTAIDRMGVAVTAGVLQLQPFVVGSMAAVLLGETLSAGQWVGGVVAVAGAALVLSAQKAAELRRARATALEEAEAAGESSAR